MAPFVFPFLFGGCPTKNGLPPKKGSVVSQGLFSLVLLTVLGQK